MYIYIKGCVATDSNSHCFVHEFVHFARRCLFVPSFSCVGTNYYDSEHGSTHVPSTCVEPAIMATNGLNVTTITSF